MNKLILKALLAFNVLFLMSSCASFITPLITPKVATELGALKQGSYSIDKSHTAVLFKIQHMGLSTYVGRFNQVDATLEFDPENIEATKLTALVEIDSLDINDDQLKNDLMSPDWFNQKVYPQAKFSTISVNKRNDGSFDFVGELAWRGIRKPIVMTATFHGGANNILTRKYTLGFSATGSFKRSDFDMADYIPLVGDDVVIEAFAEFQRN